MASLADLFVRVRGDTGDVTNKLKGVERSLSSLRLGLDGANVSTGKLQRVFGTLTTQLTGTNPAISRLSEVLGEMAVGGSVVLGVTAGAAAIVGAYELITRGARKAAEEQRKLTLSLAEQFAPKTGPESETNKKYQAAVSQQADALRHLQMVQSSSNDLEVAAKFIAAGEIVPFKKRSDLINEYTESLREANQAIARAQAGSITQLQTITVTGEKVKELTFGFNDLRDAAAKVNAEMQSANRDWWKGYIERTGEAIDITGRLEDKLIALLAKGTPLENLPGFGTAGGKPTEIDVPALVKPTVDSATKINDVAKENARMLSDTISNTAAQTASIIGNALVSFGSGRGNQIGGALGGALGGGIGTYIGHQLTTEGGKFIGGALGSAVGSVIPVVGTLVGGFLGSAIGGLFGHHKKAVDANTQALNANTKVMSQLLNEPSGFKVGRARYDASEVMSAITRAALDHRARGGAMPWSVAP